MKLVLYLASSVCHIPLFHHHPLLSQHIARVNFVALENYIHARAMQCTSNVDKSNPGVMALSMGVYVLAWQAGNKRGQRKERERIEQLRASGYLKDKQDLEDEKHEDAKEIKM